MDAPKHNTAQVWSIVLAHGRGQRLAALVKRWLSNRGTKSHKTVAGTRSSSELVVDEDPVSSHQRRITVTAQEDLTAGGAELWRQISGKFLVQPHSCGTAAAVFLGLTHVMSEDPEAMVVVYPSDHFIYPGARFAKILTDATRSLESSNSGWSFWEFTRRDWKLNTAGSNLEQPWDGRTEVIFAALKLC
jgi:mannose-1-phosphate guanylyltransferase